MLLNIIVNTYRNIYVQIQVEDLENITPKFSIEENINIEDSAQRNHTIGCRYLFTFIFPFSSNKYFISLLLVHVLDIIKFHIV